MPSSCGAALIKLRDKFEIVLSVTCHRWLPTWHYTPVLVTYHVITAEVNIDVGLGLYEYVDVEP
jgi:hypothetical protein